MSESRQHGFRVIFAFALVYVFWGSTYLGIGIAVEHIPPLLMTGTRFLIAGLLMLAWCAVSGRKIRVTLAEAVKLGVIGALLLTFANPILAHAEEVVPTGLSALIVSMTPLWFLLIDTWIFRGDRISRRGVAGLLLGIAGIVVLLWPKLREMSSNPLDRRVLLAALTLPIASFTWALGSALSKRWQHGIDAFSATGWQMAIAGALNLTLAFALGDPARAQWTASGIGAIAYLVVFGSWVGYSAYIWLLQNVPMPKVATYAYVNPVVAVFLGWVVLHETVDVYILAGSVIIVAAVALVTSAKVKAKTGADPKMAELPAVEGTGD
ncbi:MAG TPA: EamA family transporter [Terriglobales bacterium]|jgi:drug/metabolite transporter (DMT)-like permease|nr:EamA family transporter [Terriglobales bacterium]